jgi:hypothetical protein
LPFPAPPKPLSTNAAHLESSSPVSLCLGFRARSFYNSSGLSVIEPSGCAICIGDSSFVASLSTLSSPGNPVSAHVR